MIFNCIISFQKKSREQALARHDTVLRLLIRRYVTAEQKKRDEFGITEDDVREIRQDISTFRYELIDILKKNGMRTPAVDKEDTNSQYIIVYELNLTRSLLSFTWKSFAIIVLYLEIKQNIVKNITLSLFVTY